MKRWLLTLGTAVILGCSSPPEIVLTPVATYTPLATRTPIPEPTPIPTHTPLPPLTPAVPTVSPYIDMRLTVLENLRAEYRAMGSMPQELVCEGDKNPRNNSIEAEVVYCTAFWAKDGQMLLLLGQYDKNRSGDYDTLKSLSIDIRIKDLTGYGDATACESDIYEDMQCETFQDILVPQLLTQVLLIKEEWVQEIK